jgi:small GTP-binding protein
MNDAIADARHAADDLQRDDASHDAAPHPATPHSAAHIAAAIDQRLDRVEHKLQSQRLEIVVFGTISSGKSALLNAMAGRDVFATQVSGGTTTTRAEVPWPGADRVVLVDTPGLGEVRGNEHEAMARYAAADADLVLLVLDSPLRDSEAALIRILSAMDKRLLICLNKADWYHRTGTPHRPGTRQNNDAATLRNQIIQQIRSLLTGPAGEKFDERDVVLVRAAPSPRPRIRIDADGREHTETVHDQPDIADLARRLTAIVKRDGQDLLLVNLLLQSQAIAADARGQLTSLLDERAAQIIRRYMWRSGAVAAAIPLASVDIAAGLSISTKMVLELARLPGPVAKNGGHRSGRVPLACAEQRSCRQPDSDFSQPVSRGYQSNSAGVGDATRGQSGNREA